MKLEQLITNPKKSIIGLSIPMILSLFLTMINNWQMQCGFPDSVPMPLLPSVS